MLRSAAKNSGDVVVLTDPADYEKALSELEAGEVSRETRLYLMYKVYAHTAAYDSMISAYLAKKLDIDFPDSLTACLREKGAAALRRKSFSAGCALYGYVSRFKFHSQRKTGKRKTAVLQQSQRLKRAIELLKEV